MFFVVVVVAVVFISKGEKMRTLLSTALFLSLVANIIYSQTERQAQCIADASASQSVEIETDCLNTTGEVSIILLL